VTKLQIFLDWLDLVFRSIELVIGFFEVKWNDKIALTNNALHEFKILFMVF